LRGLGFFGSGEVCQFTPSMVPGYFSARSVRLAFIELSARRIRDVFVVRTNLSAIVTGTNVALTKGMAGVDRCDIEWPLFSTAPIRASKTASARSTVSGATLMDATPDPLAINAPRLSTGRKSALATP
jgi:hypothetical protein